MENRRLDQQQTREQTDFTPADRRRKMARSLRIDGTIREFARMPPSENGAACYARRHLIHRHRAAKFARLQYRSVTHAIRIGFVAGLGNRLRRGEIAGIVRTAAAIRSGRCRHGLITRSAHRKRLPHAEIGADQHGDNRHPGCGGGEHNGTTNDEGRSHDRNQCLL